jgi:hypothetical protein
MGPLHFPSSPGRYLAFTISTVSLVLLCYSALGIANMKGDPLPLSDIITADPLVQLLVIYGPFLVWASAAWVSSNASTTAIDHGNYWLKFRQSSRREILDKVRGVFYVLIIFFLLSVFLWFFVVILGLGLQNIGEDDFFSWILAMITVCTTSIVLHGRFFFWESTKSQR